MRRVASNPFCSMYCLPAGIVAAALALGLAAPSQAFAAAKEVALPTPAQALTYCMSGKMLPSDIAYIAGPPGLAQYGPGSSCAQQVPVKTSLKKSLQITGKRVSECKLAGTAEALRFCQSGAMGEYDIAYIAGKVGKTLSGPGYGCVVNFSTSSIGNSICK